MLGGTAEGNMLPSMHIIKCSSSAVDLRRTTVIKTLHKTHYTAADGWTFKEWDRVLVLKVKGVEKTLHYHRPYIVHSDGTVITTQHKAWMDSVAMCMWVDLVIGPWAKASGRKKLLVWDSCGPHKVAAVKAVFDEWGIAIEALPVNMTDALQVMDLVVNGPLKAHMRKFRCCALFKYFQSWKVEVTEELKKDVKERIIPVFAPPKPMLIDGLNTLRKVSAEVFSSSPFKAGLVRAFITVGLVKEDTSGAFVKYTSHSRGDMPPILAPVDSPLKEEFTLGELDCDSDDCESDDCDSDSDDGGDGSEDKGEGGDDNDDD